MASLLVSVPPERLGEVDLTYLDERGTLFVAAVSGDRARIVAVHEGAVEPDAPPLDHDITALLPRLGTSVGELAATIRPQIVPPGDVVLLRYTLGLPVDDPDEPEPSVILRGDPRADRLRHAVWDDLASDAPRMVYADYLCGHGDPRGELINLQLARGDGEVTARERRLVRRHALDCAEELRPYIDGRVELARGFVVRCASRSDVPRAGIECPAWATVEDLATSSLELARSRRLVSLRTLRIGGHHVPDLVTSPTPIACETLAGWSQPGSRTSGLRVNRGRWDILLRRGALERLRALALDLGRTPDIGLVGFHDSPLARGLAHLDIETALWPDQARRLRADFEHCEVPRFTIRVLLDSGVACLALTRGTAGTQLGLQIAAPVTPRGIPLLGYGLGPLAHGLRQIVVEDLGDPANVATRQAVLIAHLGTIFRDVVARPLPVAWLGL